jgi:hypothetical protein
MKVTAVTPAGSGERGDPNSSAGRGAVLCAQLPHAIARFCRCSIASHDGGLPIGFTHLNVPGSIPIADLRRTEPVFFIIR